MSVHVVIMAGGVGSRFWPMSTPERPKQFIDVLGTGRTLIQMTWDRFVPICPPENFWVVTSAKYVSLVHEQLPDLPLENVLAEPAARNTAPCIAYASWRIAGIDPHANVVVTPSDALVLDVESYRGVIAEALAFTCANDAIVTVGITPNRPETGYGYIQTSSVHLPVGNVFKVSQFREKPDLMTARSYLEAGGYLWNAGIFVWSVDTIISALRSYAPGIASVIDRIAEAGFTEESVAELFPQCEKISIDYAVMEKHPSIYTIPGNFGWSDLGTWGSLLQNSVRDEDGNAVVNDRVRLHGCSDCVVHVDNMEKVELEGLHGYIVAQSGGRLLVCRLSEEQRIKDFSENK